MAKQAPSFQVTAEDQRVILRIASRAHSIARQAGVHSDEIAWAMDITAVHANGSPLRLIELAEADDFNFSHDVFGIRNHLDRATGELRGCFVPRFSVPEAS